MTFAAATTLKPRPHTYANSLLTVVQFLASPAIRPPTLASGINSGGFLERRFKMIVSEKPIEATPAWMRLAILLCALAVLPLGVAYAQTQEKKPTPRVEKKQDKVKIKGSIRAKAYLTKVKKELAAAVAAGEISKEEADKKYQSAATAIKARLYLGQLKAKLAASVKAGEISQEDADKSFEKAKKAVGGRLASVGGTRRKSKTDPFVEYAAAEKKLQALVAAGKISQEDADKRLAEHKKYLLRGEKSRRLVARAAYAELQKKLQAAVEAGKMSQEEADKKLLDFRKGLGAEKKNPRALYAGMERRLQAAVEAGKMTQAEADEKLIEFRKQLGKENREKKREHGTEEGRERRSGERRRR